jgi:hypothetical protein
MIMPFLMRFEPLPKADIPFTLSLRTTVNLLGGLKLSDLPLVLVDLSAPCINHNKQRDKGKYDDQCPRGVETITSKPDFRTECL